VEAGGDPAEKGKVVLLYPPPYAADEDPTRRVTLLFKLQVTAYDSVK
jgi:hypothetical protein